MEAYRETYGERLEKSRWSATEESITAYRGDIDDVLPRCAYTLNEADQQEQTDLFERFCQGKLELDTFISELNRTLYMSVLEDR